MSRSVVRCVAIMLLAMKFANDLLKNNIMDLLKPIKLYITELYLMYANFKILPRMEGDCDKCI